MTTTWTSVATPDGPFAIIAAQGAVLASGWTDEPRTLLTYIHPSLRPTDIHRAGDDDPVLRAARDTVRAYYNGHVTAVEAVPVRQVSGPFRERAWEQMRHIRPGHPVSYGELASALGAPRAARAAGSACSHNAVPLFVPCHRVIAAGGDLGGFAYGLDLKRRLLAREGWEG